MERKNHYPESQYKKAQHKAEICGLKWFALIITFIMLLFVMIEVVL